MKNYKLTINGNKYSVDIADIEDSKTTVEVNGTPYVVELDMPVPASRPQVKKVVKLATPPTPQAAPATASVAPAPAAPSGGSAIKSPLPGVVLNIFVNVGDQVKAGQHLLLLEAMKMENNIDADRDGKIAEIRVAKGDTVMEGAVLVTIE